MSEAARRIKQARRLLVVVGGEADQAAIEAAFHLAGAASAALLAADPVEENLALAMKSTGLLTATLGDLRSLIAQVVLLGASPETFAPRLWHFIGQDKQDTAITLPSSLETLRWLRLHTRQDIFQPLPEELIPVAEKIAAAPSGAVIFGPPGQEDTGPYFHELLAWLADLNRDGRWYGLYLPGSPNTTGVMEALLSVTGCPGSLHFEDGRASYAAHEFRLETAVQESDAILVIGGSAGLTAAETWSPACQQRAILLSPAAPGWKPGLWLPVAQPGLDAPGSMLRLDGLPVELEPLLPGKRPSAACVLESLAREAAA